MYTAEQLVEALGIRLRQRKDIPWDLIFNRFRDTLRGVSFTDFLKIAEEGWVPPKLPYGAKSLGLTNVREGTLVKWQGRIEVWQLDEDSEFAALHEALHGVIGPHSFRCEITSGLMAYEWAVCQELAPSLYRQWRGVFATYCLSGSELGEKDNFFASLPWMQCVMLAQKAGLLDIQSRPVWGHGPHPDL